MTDDIVARVRKYADWQGLAGYFSDDLKEAVDRIEQLENQISHIIEHNNPQIENANSHFKLLEEELARCNKIMDEYEAEHSKLRAALRLLIEWHDDTGAVMLPVLIDVARAALEGEQTDDCMDRK
jgi:DNA repair exonuclease SbcCD ATPase subunit